MDSPAVSLRVGGKFLRDAETKVYLRGVTYGTFRPNSRGEPYPDPATVDEDFAAMAAVGVNSVRTYTVPPPWLLDLAGDHELSVMVGIPWQQHVAFLEDRRTVRSIEQAVHSGVQQCAEHSSVLCYAIGNEIPSSIARWYGRRRIEHFLECLYDIAKTKDPERLVTYVNYPTTEYLELPFLDLVVLQRLPRIRAAPTRLPFAATEPGRRAPSFVDRGRSRQSRPWQGRTGERAELAAAHCFRSGLCRNIRVRVDGRVASRWPRRHRVELRRNRLRAPAQGVSACAD